MNKIEAGTIRLVQMVSGGPRDRDVTYKLSESEKTALGDLVREEDDSFSGYTRGAVQIRMLYQGYDQKLVKYSDTVKSVLDALP